MREINSLALQWLVGEGNLGELDEER